MDISLCIFLALCVLKCTHPVTGQLLKYPATAANLLEVSNGEIFENNFPATKIDLILQDVWQGLFDLNDDLGELHINQGYTFQKTAPASQIYQQHFGGIAPQNLQKTHDESIIFKTPNFKEKTSTLEITPKKPGTFTIIFSTVEDRTDPLEHFRWTVYSVPTLHLHRGSFFNISLELAKIQVTEDVQVSDLGDISVDVHSVPGTIFLYGLPNALPDETILSIRMMSRSKTTSLKLRLNTTDNVQQEDDKPRTFIELHAFKSLSSVRIKNDLARCVAEAFAQKILNFSMVSFTQVNLSTIKFKAELAGITICNVKDRILQRIDFCPYNLIQLNVTSRPKCSFRTLLKSGDNARTKLNSIPTKNVSVSKVKGATTNTKGLKEPLSTEQSTTAYAADEERNWLVAKHFGLYQSASTHIKLHALIWGVVFVVLLFLMFTSLV